MKFYTRQGLYKASNVTLNPKTLEAFSYSWWKFLGVVEGKLVFNNYRYSNSTSKHQSKVRAQLQELGIKIDISMPIPSGLPGTYGSYSRFGQESCPSNGLGLAELIQVAEEHLCNEFLGSKLKAQKRYQESKARKLKKRLEAYLENDVAFRDYKIVDRIQFGKRNDVAVHQCVDAASLEHDVQNALYSFHRDGFGSIVFYVGGES